jgi:hypothetical protein
VWIAFKIPIFGVLYVLCSIHIQYAHTGTFCTLLTTSVPKARSKSYAASSPSHFAPFVGWSGSNGVWWIWWRNPSNRCCEFTKSTNVWLGSMCCVEFFQMISLLTMLRDLAWDNMSTRPQAHIILMVCKIIFETLFNFLMYVRLAPYRILYRESLQLITERTKSEVIVTVRLFAMLSRTADIPSMICNPFKTCGSIWAGTSWL